MVWHAETIDGKLLTSRKPDRQINPASIVKAATTLLALEVLGPEFWFETRIQSNGRHDTESGVLHGDLLVIGSGDPDFQPENGFMIARRLNELGIEKVTGRLLVNDRFWIGWEGGKGKVVEDPERRARVMAARMRRALDPHRWDRAMQRIWRRYASRHGLPVRRIPRVHVAGGYGPNKARLAGRTVLVHRSKPLADVLRRFNCYSNNDIERLERSIGSATVMADRLKERWDLEDVPISFETSSGLGTNRMTPRLIVRLLRDLVATCGRRGIRLEDVLPVAGCDPGTLRKFFPALNSGAHASSVTGKTGTLIYTDGGVSVFAGVAGTAGGTVVFCVAVPRGGRRRHWARRQQERWVLDLVEASGGPVQGICPPPLPMPDTGARILTGEGIAGSLTIAPSAGTIDGEDRR